MKTSKLSFVATLLIFAIVLSCFSSVNLVFTQEEPTAEPNPFSYFDHVRESSFDTSLAFDDKPKTKPSFTSPEKVNTNSKRFIVRFKDSVSLNEIYEAIKFYPFTLLAQSERRIFSLELDNPEAFKKLYGGIIAVFEQDNKKSLSSTVNDPYALNQWELDALDLYRAWDITVGDPDVIVAILDSGINRKHSDLQGANILNGYDAVQRISGVDLDYNGHGTKIASIIAAVQNNSIGISGISPGVSILPIRLLSESGYIYSSDFINAVYYAADAGASVINMSFGGYTYSALEEEAVRYAHAKGCILTAASGNEGNVEDKAGLKAYPASYDKVISVGAIYSDGTVCEFSQFNESVDLVAPGADITVASQSNHFITEIGTSFATAYISAVAALARSAITDGISLNGDEFLALAKKLNGKKHNNKEGYGSVNAFKILENINIPIVTGVSSGNIYHENITITYNRGSATLDGKPFKSGDNVIVSGLHVLEVKDGNITVTYSFTTDNLPLQYNYKETDSYSYFTFSRGTATLDGVPYLSGDKISTDGAHTFVLKGPYGNSETHVFETDFSAPAVFGLKDGATYTSPVSVTFAGSGKVFLNGQEMSSNFSVDRNGTHTVTAESKTGLDKTTYTFSIKIEGTTEFKPALANAKLIVDEAYNTIMLYNDVLTGVRVHLKDSPDKMSHFVNTGKPVKGYSFFDEMLLLYHDDSITVCDRKLLSENAHARVDTIYLKSEYEACTFYGEELFYTVSENEGYSVYKTNVLNGETHLILSTGLTLSSIAADKDHFYVSNGHKLVMYKKTGEKLLEISLNKAFDALTAENGLVFTGSELFDLSAPDSPKIILNLSTPEHSVKLTNEVLVTLKNVYDVSNGLKLGSMGFGIYDAVISESGIVYKSYLDKTVSIKTNQTADLVKSNALEFLHATPYEEPFVSPGGESSPFTNTLHFSFDSLKTQPIVNNFKNEIYIISESERALIVLDLTSLNLKKTLRFRYTPCALTSLNSSIVVGFSGTSVVYTVNNYYGGSYHSISVHPSQLMLVENSILVLGDDGKLYIGNNKSITDLSVFYSGGEVLSFTADASFVYILCNTEGQKTLLQLSLTNGETVAQTVTKDSSTLLIQSNSMLHLGTKAFSKLDSLNLAYNTANEVIAAYQDVFLTSYGLHRSANGFSVSQYRTNGLYFTFDNYYNLVSSDTRTLWKIKGAGSPLDKRSITGVSDGEIASGKASIAFNQGKGFLNTKPYTSGEEITEGGSHSFILLLPYGITKKIDFTLEAVLSGINISLSDDTIGINESAKITVSFVPHSSGTPEVIYSTDSDIVNVSADGTVTGLTVGTALITATSVDGKFSASAKISVTSSYLKFDSSYFKVEREAGFVKIGVSGTTLDTLTSATAKSPGKVKVLAVDGSTFNGGKLGTGMTVILQNSRGETIDSLKLSVKGDLDGDGYISVGDLAILCDHFNKQNALTPAVLYAADIDGSNKVDEVDLLCLKNHVLKSELIDGKSELPLKTSESQPKLSAPHSVSPGDEFEISFTITDANGITAVSSLLVYDPEILDLKQVAVHESKGWETEYDDIAPGYVSFLGHGSPIKRNRTLITVTFIALQKSEPYKTIEVTATETVVCSNGGARVADTKTTILADGSSQFEISIPNADSFVFDPNVREYSLHFPSDVSRVEINCYPKEAARFEGELNFSKLDEINFAVIYTDNSGKEIRYSFKALRDLGGESSEPDDAKSNNAKLIDLTPSVGTLSPGFSKEINDYYLFIPFDYNELFFTYKTDDTGCTVALNQPSEYKVGTPGVVTLECTAEDGTKELYTITVNRADEGTSTSFLSEEPTEKDGSAALTVTLIILSALAIITLFGLALRKRSG